MIRQVIIQIKAGEVSSLLFLDLVDMKLGEEHTAFSMIWVGKLQKTFWEKVFCPDIFWRHRCQGFPGHVFREFNSYTLLYGFSPRHGYVLARLSVKFERSLRKSI